MTSEVEICNLALSNIRAGSINSLDESSLQAQQCKLKYQFMRNRCLKEVNAGFSNKIAVLAVLTTEIFNWAYAYQYPNDCLKIRRLIGAHEELANADADVVSRLIDSQLLPLRDLRTQIDYEVFNFDDNRVIGANESELRAGYVVKVTNPTLFTDDFVLALSHLLAAEVAIPIVGAETGRQLRSDELQLYNSYLESATSDNLNEQYFSPGESEYVTIRR